MLGILWVASRSSIGTVSRDAAIPAVTFAIDGVVDSIEPVRRRIGRCTTTTNLRAVRSVVIGMILVIAVSACGGDDTDPMPLPDGQVATGDGANPATDSDPSLPECKADVSKMHARVQGNQDDPTYIEIGVTGDDYSSEPKARVEATYKTYHKEYITTSRGFFSLSIFPVPAPTSSEDFPKSVTVTISKKTCRTKSAIVAIERL